MTASRGPALPESLRDLLGARIAALPGATRDALAVTAALSVATLDRVSSGANGDAGSLLEPAVEAGIVEVEDGRVRFAHPLLAAAAWEATPRRLGGGRSTAGWRSSSATARSGPATSRSRPTARTRRSPRRSRRPRGTRVPAARPGRRRSWPGWPCAGPRRSASTTRAGARSWKRSIALIAGDAARARRLNEGLLATAAPGRPRAEVLTLQAIIDLQAYDLRGALDVLREALDEADDDRLRMRCEGLMTAALDDLETDVDEAIAHGMAELELAERLGDEVHVATALRGDRPQRAAPDRPLAHGHDRPRDGRRDDGPRGALRA